MLWKAVDFVIGYAIAMLLLGIGILIFSAVFYIVNFLFFMIKYIFSKKYIDKDGFEKEDFL